MRASLRYSPRSRERRQQGSAACAGELERAEDTRPIPEGGRDYVITEIPAELGCADVAGKELSHVAADEREKPRLLHHASPEHDSLR